MPLLTLTSGCIASLKMISSHNSPAQCSWTYRVIQVLEAVMELPCMVKCFSGSSWFSWLHLDFLDPSTTFTWNFTLMKLQNTSKQIQSKSTTTRKDDDTILVKIKTITSLKKLKICLWNCNSSKESLKGNILIAHYSSISAQRRNCFLWKMEPSHLWKQYENLELQTRTSFLGVQTVQTVLKFLIILLVLCKWSAMGQWNMPPGLRTSGSCTILPSWDGSPRDQFFAAHSPVPDPRQPPQPYPCL